MIGAAVLVIVLGLVLIVVAVASWQGRLPRNMFAGVRTPSTMRSDQAFKVANKVAAPLTAAGGAVLALGGVLSAVLGTGPVLLACALVCAVLCVLGAIKGVRAIRTL